MVLSILVCLQWAHHQHTVCSECPVLHKNVMEPFTGASFVGLGPALSCGHEAISSSSPCCLLSFSELHMRVHRRVEVKGLYFPLVPQSVNYL